MWTSVKTPQIASHWTSRSNRCNCLQKKSYRISDTGFQKTDLVKQKGTLKSVSWWRGDSIFPVYFVKLAVYSFRRKRIFSYVLYKKALNKQLLLWKLLVHMSFSISLVSYRNPVCTLWLWMPSRVLKQVLLLEMTRKLWSIVSIEETYLLSIRRAFFIWFSALAASKSPLARSIKYVEFGFSLKF